MFNPNQDPDPNDMYTKYHWNPIKTIQVTVGTPSTHERASSIYLHLILISNMLYKRPSVRYRCLDDNSNTFFIGFHFFQCMHHLGQDLGWDWIWVSNLIKYAHYGRSCDFIKYAHYGRSCDLDILGIPEVNFSVRGFKLGMFRDLRGAHDISSGFCQSSICVFFRIVYAFPSICLVSGR